MNHDRDTSLVRNVHMLGKMLFLLLQLRDLQPGHCWMTRSQLIPDVPEQIVGANYTHGQKY